MDGAKLRSSPLLMNSIICMHMMGYSDEVISKTLGTTRQKIDDLVKSPVGEQIRQRLLSEVKTQTLDPVKEQLESFAKEAMDELWRMRNEVTSEKLKKEILVDVLHMAGYRPNTNTDREVERLPMIMIGQMNVQQNHQNHHQSPPDSAQILPISDDPCHGDLGSSPLGESQSDDCVGDDAQGQAQEFRPVRLGLPGHHEHENHEEQSHATEQQSQAHRISIHEIWGRDDQTDAQDAGRYERSTWRSQGQGGSGQGRADSPCSGDSGEELTEPTFGPELVGATVR